MILLLAKLIYSQDLQRYINEGKPYSYSNITMQPNQWSQNLLQIKNKVENVCKVQFSTVLYTEMVKIAMKQVC
jgi:hypothetical protein